MIRLFKKFTLAATLIVACSLFLMSACSGDDDDEEDDGDDDDDDDDDDFGYGTTELQWMPIAGGAFEMGCSAGDTICAEDESPVHTVTISPMEMTASEITQSQFFEVMGENPSQYGECSDCPVENVVWLYAKLFCQAMDGRLPTEAEWEYAARANSTTKYYCGDDNDCLNDIAWYKDNSQNTPQPVGQKEPNDFGLYDMLGNIREWVNDSYDAQYYAQSPGQDPSGPSEGTGHILRGGAVSGIASFMRASDRFWIQDNVAIDLVGFRCVRAAQ